MRKRTFPDMTKILPATERRAGHFYIEHLTVDRHSSRMSTLGGGLSYVPEGRYCGLKKANANGNTSLDTLWMSDTPLEHNTNYDILRRARGDVLVVGLGIGMVAVALCRKPEVRRVTVLELEPEVAALVAPHIRHRKLRVLVADGNAPPLRGRAFDTIYIDIWPNICSDNWETMKPLLARYRKFQRPGGGTDAWMKDWAQREHRASRGRYYA